ncbi:MAG TPA: hypothetical protein VN256_03380 [Pyrinomonadaceae bacterium]|nr:hypothetical protein [Pyrinomonadaceae bacterium]
MTDERIIAYLLGELPEDESEQFDFECFDQEEWPDIVSLGEEDLIDAYLRGELTPERRQRFEQNYLVTEERKKRVAMAAALLRQVDEYRIASEVAVAARPARLTWAERLRALWNNQGWALRAAASLGAVVILAAILWLALFRGSSPKNYAQLTLTPAVRDRAGGAQAARVKPPPDADGLRVTLILPERLPPAEGYRVELEDEDGKKRPLEVAGQDARSVSVVIPASHVARGQYVLNLFTTSADGTEQPVRGGYFFMVE